MSLWRQSLENWLKTIDVSGSVLDVGGAQNPVKGRTKSWDVDDYLIIDKENDLSDEWIQPRRYDNVFCLETVMYTTDPTTAILNLVNATGKNLYISNPLEAYGETKPEGTDMVRLFPSWWKYWLTELGMEIKEMTVVEPSNPLLSAQLRKSEGYKMIRPHASGVLIWAVRK